MLRPVKGKWAVLKDYQKDDDGFVPVVYTDRCGDFHTILVPFTPGLDAVLQKKVIGRATKLALAVAKVLNDNNAWSDIVVGETRLQAKARR